MKKAGRTRGINLIMVVVFIFTTITGNIGFNTMNVEASNEIPTTIFAQGAGTGIELNASSWNFNGAYRTGSGFDYTSASLSYKTGIKTNQYSGNNEDVIRLIDGVQARPGSHTYASGFRSGSAFINSGIDLDDDCSFSAKFTISMPGAVVDDDGNYTRAPGGDGIAFVVQPNANPVGKPGDVLGYAGIQDSIAIELDSFFNGAYYSAAGADGYQNWGYDNQIYNYNGTGGLNSGNIGIGNYVGIPANKWQSFDHIGVLMNGNPLEHKEIYYLAGLDPTETNSDNKYANLGANITDLAGITDSADIPNTSQRFSDYVDGGTSNNVVKEVNNRLFTVWIEYDGEVSKNLEVRIALGDFKTAQRLAPAQITYRNPDLGSIFKVNDTVYLGFTSAIGSSKANHTVHSIEFINQYYSDGVPTSSTYQVEYYLEGSGGYVLQTGDILSGQSGTVGDTVTAPSKTYPGYTKTVTQNTLESAAVAADGSTVLKVYYGRNTNTDYKVEYYLENASGGYSLEESENKTGTTGATVTVDTKTYLGYAETTTPNTLKFATIAGDGSTVLKVYYARNTNTAYKVEYYLENASGGYNLEESENKTGTTGAAVTADTKTYPGYTETTTPDTLKSSTIAADGSTVLKVYYAMKSQITASGITITDKTYDGIPIIPNGTVQVKRSDNQSIVTDNAALVYTYSGTGNTIYSSAAAPKNAGTYKLIITASEDDTKYTGSCAEIPFTISKATVMITAENKTAAFGGTIPAYTYTVAGLAPAEALKVGPSLSCKPDMNNAGNYTIIPSGAKVPDGDNYEDKIIYVNGTLTVQAVSYIAVTNIEGVPTKATVGTSMILTGTVQPTSATNRTITWRVKNKGTTGARISSGKLTTTGTGTAIITATVKNGKTKTTNFTKDYSIKVSYAINKGSTYTVSGYRYKVTSITNSKKEVTFTGLTTAKKKIATTIDIKNTVKINSITLKVTAVGKDALKRNGRVKTVKIGNNVQTINYGAFSECNELKSVTIGTGLRTIDSHAFCYDAKLKNITIKSTKLRSVSSSHVFLRVKATVKVPSSKVSAYKKLLADKKGSLTIKR